MGVLKSNAIWFVFGVFVLGFALSCSTGPDYKRDSEFDVESKNYRPGFPGEFVVSVTEEGFYHLSWDDVKNNDGFIVDRYVELSDTTLYDRIAVLGADETSVTDSSGIGENPYFYVISSFVNNGDNIKKGRDSLYFYVETTLGEIESIEYEHKSYYGEILDRIVISTQVTPSYTQSTRRGLDHKRFKLHLLSGVILEAKTDLNDFKVLDTLWLDLRETEDSLLFKDTVRGVVKKFRARPLLKEGTVHEVGEYTKEVTKVVENPFRINLTRLDEILVEYTVSVGEGFEWYADSFEGVHVYFNDTLVDTLTGEFPQTHTLNTWKNRFISDNRVSISAFLKNAETNRRHVSVKNRSIHPPKITEVRGSERNQLTINWTHEADDYLPNVNSFVIERRSDEISPFESVATVGPDARTYQNSGLTEDFYQYRVRTQTSDASNLLSTRYTDSFDFTKTAENSALDAYDRISSDMIHRLSQVSKFVYDVYRYKNKIDQIDLTEGDLPADMYDPIVLDFAFSEDGRSIVFLLRETSSPAVLVYDLDVGDFKYTKFNLASHTNLDMVNAKVAYSRELGKIFYLDKLNSENKLGVVDIESDTDFLYDFPTGMTAIGSGLIPFENSILMYNGRRETINISVNTENDITITNMDYQPIRVLESDSELYEFRGDDLFVVDLENFSEASVTVKEDQQTLLLFHLRHLDKRSNTIFYRGIPLGGRYPSALFAYNSLTEESVQIADLNPESDDYFKKTSNGVAVIQGTDEYLISQSDKREWVYVRPQFAFFTLGNPSYVGN